LAETSAIPVIVLSRQQDPVEIINGTMRSAGHPVHCAWIRDLAGLGDSLTGATPQLIFMCLDDDDDVREGIALRDRHCAGVPAIVVREAFAEKDLDAATAAGAQDVVSLASGPRLQAVATRELNLARLERSLAGTLASARNYRDQMRAFMTGSTDAIAHVQEGIIVDVNPSWTELFGRADAGELLGLPIMDLFHSRSHAVLKGALVAAAQGRWTGHSLDTVASLPDGSDLPLDLVLERFDYEDEPAVRLRILSQQRDLESLSNQLEEALQKDDVTGLLKPRAWRDVALAKLKQPLKGGCRMLAYLELDGLGQLGTTIGPFAVPEILDQFGALLRNQLHPGDLAGRVTHGGFAVLLERGNERDVEAWLGRVLQTVAKHVFQVGPNSTSLTASAGIASCDSAEAGLDPVLRSALHAGWQAAGTGGNRYVGAATEDDTTETDALDHDWVARIKSALMANRFRLVQQPIASLVGEDSTAVDLLVRMLDEQGEEVLPSEFLRAAERNDLTKNIDRWVLGAAMSYCAARKPDRVFLRISRASLLDASLGPWLEQQLRAAGIEPRMLVIQVGEALAATHLREAKRLREDLKSIGIGFAIENFGSGQDSSGLLAHLAPDFVKIDGALMQGLPTDPPLQEQVKALSEEAKTKGASTIAERVEDANTMAVLWQLGVEFVQGYFVNQPEEVVLGADGR